MQDIADALGYSKNAVSLALRNRPEIPYATREKIRQKAEEMGYQTNPVVSRLMAELRSSQTPKFQAKLALINANENRNALDHHPTIPAYVRGCERRAFQLGYSFDRFWLHDPEFSAKRVLQILDARNIRGIVVVGLMGQNQLPKSYIPVWDAIPTVVTGVRTRQPALSYACVDHHHLALRAVERVVSRGYKRPALIVDQSIDDLVQGRFSAGFMVGQKLLAKKNRIDPFLEYKKAKKDPSLFKAWMDKNKPDAVLTLYNSIHTWLVEMGFKIPEDIAFAQLERRPSHPDMAGMNQHNDVAGEAAVEMVISQINNNEQGIPDFPRATLIGATWQDGATIRS
ncbi:LacI family DNA-binding transcriptional regulator [Pelagicoccus sp. SDUM812003]|uniref:LacI family DNA-binding transcriptional regulator n=1 Tax=Pelagicoccus sp. SDUM812003 TaxID=3041267 RepID=UPI00280DF397|nr:LacI family DNA-binding transcriptional regulator [Pelagicoccus sp. SDUM812003]MDQ8205494.1 LacI family DNA-binding transcriptional regulator [Pelagicoccus sp. SDUM812003]